MKKQIFCLRQSPCLNKIRYPKTDLGRRNYIQDSLAPKRYGKFIYLFIGLLGLAGAVLIIIRVIGLDSISCGGMVLLFGASAVCMGAMMLGFNFFYQCCQNERRRK
jgi:hypothetical protein